jgi:hypothetical protein
MPIGGVTSTAATPARTSPPQAAQFAASQQLANAIILVIVFISWRTICRFVSGKPLALQLLQ